MVYEEIDLRGFSEGSNIFVSQRNQLPYGDSGCGVACAMMLLKHIDFRPLPAWHELCTNLHLEQDPKIRGYQNDVPAVGLYPEDLFRYIIRQNFHFRMHFFDDEWQSALLKAPIMVLLDGILEEFPEDAHWVVLIKLDNGYFSYLDPWEKSYKLACKQISFDRFKQIYTGLACQLLACRGKL